MGCVFATKPAILHKLKSVGIILLILCCIIISLLALAASHGNPYSHFAHSNAIRYNLSIKKNAYKAINILSYTMSKVKHVVLKKHEEGGISRPVTIIVFAEPPFGFFLSIIPREARQ